jgi:uncharacterized protein YoxC
MKNSQFIILIIVLIIGFYSINKKIDNIYNTTNHIDVMTTEISNWRWHGLLDKSL